MPSFCITSIVLLHDHWLFDLYHNLLDNTSDDITKWWGSYQNLIHAWTYINLISRLQFDYIIMHMHLFTMYYYHKCFNCFLKNNSIITAPTCALITTSWYTKMVKMYNIKLTEHLLYTIILCLLLSLYST